MFLITNFLNESKGTPYGVPCIIFYRDAIYLVSKIEDLRSFRKFGGSGSGVRGGLNFFDTSGSLHPVSDYIAT